MFNIFKTKKKSTQTGIETTKPVWALDDEYYRILDKQMSDDPKERLEATIEMCRYLGVREERIIKSVEEAENFFESDEPVVL